MIKNQEYHKTWVRQTKAKLKIFLRQYILSI